ncbi:MAG TPA: hypothetical protein VM600_00690, partial [Actinomycetota bacterium]|nr:hypothetical protein [Actinomycetota bacterium]
VQQFEQLTETGKMPWWPNVEEFNRQSHEQCLELSVHDAQAMMQAARHRFREEIARLAEPVHEKIERAIIGCGTGHYEEHIPMLDAFFAGAGR